MSCGLELTRRDRPARDQQVDHDSDAWPWNPDSTGMIGPVDFSIGICVSGEARETLARLMEVVREEVFPSGFCLARIIVVSSEPSVTTKSILDSFAAEDGRVLLINESERKGKIDAVNKIISNHLGSYVVFLNGDAIPERGSMSCLISRISSQPRAGVVSARPTFRRSGDLNSRVLDLMWETHNASSLRLNHMGLSNHACDELMVVRSEALVTLPTDLVNDGAYISGHAFARGYRILFSEDSKVTIDVPWSIRQLIDQRRRILFGHAQIWKKLGRPPLTLESLLLLKPQVALGIVGHVVAARPSRLLVIPMALMAELVAFILSVRDRMSSTKRHTVWRRYRK